MASVLKRGGVWYAKWTDASGKRRREPTQAASKAEARALAAELEVEARRRRSLLQRARNGLPPRPEDLAGSLAELCTWWLEHRCPEGSRGNERQRLRKHVLSTAVGAVPLSAVTSAQLDELLHTVEDAGASAASVNKLRSVLHTVFSKAKKAGKWVGENPTASTERRKVAKRVYATLRAEEVPLLLAKIPAEWLPLFAAALWTGMRRGELFALRKSDVDLTLGTIVVARSNARDTTKGGHADLIPVAAPLFPILKHQLEHAPGSLVFPAPDGSQRSSEADPQKILRTALARAGLVEGYQHVCRWCGHEERHQDNEQRYCPKCLKRTNGTGKLLANPRGRALWPKAIPRKMRFHDLRHTTATLLLRAGVDAHRVQRLLRHRDVRTTTTIYGHLDVEDLRSALEKLPQLGPNWVQAAQGDQDSLAGESVNAAESEGDSWWALQDSNLRPLPCEGSALPLS
jgi:integrase